MQLVINSGLRPSGCCEPNFLLGWSLCFPIAITYRCAFGAINEGNSSPEFSADDPHVCPVRREFDNLAVVYGVYRLCPVVMCPLKMYLQLIRALGGAFSYKNIYIPLE